MPIKREQQTSIPIRIVMTASTHPHHEGTKRMNHGRAVVKPATNGLPKVKPQVYRAQYIRADMLY